MTRKSFVSAILSLGLALTVAGCYPYPYGSAYPNEAPEGYYDYDPGLSASYPGRYPYSSYPGGYYGHSHHRHYGDYPRKDARRTFHRDPRWDSPATGQPAPYPSPVTSFPPRPPAPTLNQRLERVERKIEHNQQVFPRQLGNLERREDRQETKIERKFDRMEQRRLENMERRGASEEAQRAMQQQLQQREQQQMQRLQQRFDAREQAMRQNQMNQTQRLEQKRGNLERKIQSQFPPGGGGNGGCGMKRRMRGEC